MENANGNKVIPITMETLCPHCQGIVMVSAVVDVPTVSVTESFTKEASSEKTELLRKKVEELAISDGAKKIYLSSLDDMNGKSIPPYMLDAMLAEVDKVSASLEKKAEAPAEGTVSEDGNAVAE
jgi:hypothetical protein